MPLFQLLLQKTSGHISRGRFHNRFLVPIKVMSTIIQSKHGSLTEDALQALGVLSVDESILHEFNSPCKRLIVQLLGNAKKPKSLLEILLFWVKTDVSRFKHLKPGMHCHILDRFASTKERGLLTSLRKVPSFLTIGGGFR